MVIGRWFFFFFIPSFCFHKHWFLTADFTDVLLPFSGHPVHQHCGKFSDCSRCEIWLVSLSFWTRYSKEQVSSLFWLFVWFFLAVIDFCLTRRMVCDHETNLQYLSLTWASKTSCNQRRGTVLTTFILFTCVGEKMLCNYNSWELSYSIGFHMSE